MPVLKSPGLDMHYRVDDCTDPWTAPETILLLHGCAESGIVWYRWMPQLVRKFRVVRPDMRGFGQSTPMAADFPWTLDTIIDDYTRLMDHLGIEKFHLVSAKIGGTIARAFAARRPQRVQTLTLIGTPLARRPGFELVPKLIKEFETHGAEHWARRTMASRLGGFFPPEGVEWWTKFMGCAAVSTLMGFNKHINYADVTPDLPNIVCPTQVIVTNESGLGSVEHTRTWQQLIPDSTLLVLPGNSYHVAATHAEACAEAVMKFIEKKHMKPDMRQRKTA
ncbi:MAG TPA: alpha/beta hydrolase [Burkholderiales bacterium]|nr:alpha/beta hydrolase [Burkholderiales bacterium]